jgi:hypothetical protein
MRNVPYKARHQLMFMTELTVKGESLIVHLDDQVLPLFIRVK